MARFVSNAKEFRVFLGMTPSGGKWADFTNGEYETDNEAYAKKLRDAPNFKRDFYEVGEVDNKPKETYVCPEECGYTADTPKKAVLHCRMVHKSRYKEKDIKKLEEVKVA